MNIAFLMIAYLNFIALTQPSTSATLPNPLLNHESTIEYLNFIEPTQLSMRATLTNPLPSYKSMSEVQYLFLKEELCGYLDIFGEYLKLLQVETPHFIKKYINEMEVSNDSNDLQKNLSITTEAENETVEQATAKNEYLDCSVEKGTNINEVSGGMHNSKNDDEY